MHIYVYICIYMYMSIDIVLGFAVVCDMRLLLDELHKTSTLPNLLHKTTLSSDLTFTQIISQLNSCGGYD